MRRSQLLLVLTALSILSLGGCSRRPHDPRAALIGKYRLHWGTNSDCSGLPITDSELELRADGTSEQRENFKDGSQVVTRGKWSYDNDGVLFDNLRAGFGKDASATAAGLIVQWANPPNILLNPDDSCLYAKE